MDEMFLQQALFGYEDGHRLLQSSIRLSNYEKDLLLQLSDLAPGISKLREDGYWTGMPLRESSRYALLRTWPAPEKSRPGCVWTHAILIPFDYLRSESDPFWVIAHFRRPQSQKRFSEYAEPLAADGSHLTPATPAIRQARELVSCVYFSRCSIPSPLNQDQLGAQAVGIWAQQWPELRTAFNFRTLEKSNTGRSWLLNFDMMLTDGALRLQREVVSPTVIDLVDGHGVEFALVEELEVRGESDYRDFRRTYSLDLPLHPVWTGFLTAVQVRVREIVELPRKKAYEGLLEGVATALPERAAGLRLKGALLDFSFSSPLRLPYELSASAIAFLAHSGSTSSFPVPAFSDEVLSWLWANDRMRLLESLTDLDVRREDIRQYLLTELVRVIPVDQLMTGTEDVSEVRKAFVSLRPELLQWEGLVNLTGHEIADLLDPLTEDQIKELDLVRGLIFKNDAALARFLCDRFPTEIVFSVCINGSYVTHRGQPQEIILRFVGEVASRYIGSEFISRLTTTTALLSFAAMLGFVNTVTVAAGPEIWGSALRDAVTDSPRAELQTLQAFAVSLAIAGSRPGADTLLEYSFEPLHEAMRELRLDYQASVIIEPHLPDVGWWHRWDNCYRLRIAVIRAYAYGDLSPQSFLRLAKHESLMSALLHELESNNEFHLFLDKVRRIASTAR